MDKTMNDWYFVGAGFTPAQNEQPQWIAPTQKTLTVIA